MSDRSPSCSPPPWSLSRRSARAPRVQAARERDSPGRCRDRQVRRDADGHHGHLGDSAHVRRLRLAALQQHRHRLREHRRRGRPDGLDVRPDLGRRRPDRARRRHGHRRRRLHRFALGRLRGRRDRRGPGEQRAPDVSGTTTRARRSSPPTARGPARRRSRSPTPGRAATRRAPPAPRSRAPRQDLRAYRRRRRQDPAGRAHRQEHARQRAQTSAPTAHDRPACARDRRDAARGRQSIDATDVKLPAAARSSTRCRSRPTRCAPARRSPPGPRLGHRGYAVRNALVFVQGLPFGRSSTPAEVKTGSDGAATLTLIPTHRLPLQGGASLVMFIRARVTGDRLIAGVSTRRLVNLRVVPCLLGGVAHARGTDPGRGR